MTSTDYLALAAVVVSVLGWFATFLTQMASNQTQARFHLQVQTQLEVMKEEFARAREQRQFILPSHIENLNRIDAWLAGAMQVGSRLIDTSRQMQSGDPTWPRNLEKVKAEFDTWNEEFNFCYTTALKYNSVPPSETWARHAAELDAWIDNDVPPSTLWTLITFMRTTVQVLYDDVVDRRQHVRYLTSIEPLYVQGAKLVNVIRTEVLEGRTQHHGQPRPESYLASSPASSSHIP
jgi:hypothetical protein